MNELVRSAELLERQRGKKEAFILLPNGLESRGGIGQAMRNLLEGLLELEDTPHCRVIDSWHGEWRIRRSPISPIYFGRAVLSIVAARIGGYLGLLHLNMSERGSLLRKLSLVWLATLLRVPAIIHVHSAYLPEDLSRYSTPVRLIVRLSLDRAHFVIVLGSFWQHFFVRQLHMDPAKVVIIPYGVPEPQARRALLPAAAMLRLLFLGRLGERKGTPEVLDALADRRVRGLDWTLTLAGDGEVESMQARAEELGIGNRCRFAGWLNRPQVVELLARSDVLLLPSRAEGLPVAILEAMAYGLTIITAPVAAIEDAIADHETGLLVPAGDAAALAAALLEVMSDAGLREKLGHAARDRYRREFTLKIYADRVRRLYRRCGV
jgi:glycosyltransferase involved in cell wall biosynthesis